MKKTAAFSTAILFFLAMSAKSQDSTSTRIREYYVSVANVSPLNIHLKYKKQVGNNLFFKVGLVSLSGNFTESSIHQSGSFSNGANDFSGGVSVGLEFRKVISKKFTFFQGPNLTGVYRYAANRNLNPDLAQGPRKMDSNSFSGSIPYTLGLLFHLKDNFFIAAEVNPMVYVNYTETTAFNGNSEPSTVKFSNFSGGFGFDNQYGLISLVYRR